MHHTHPNHLCAAEVPQPLLALAMQPRMHGALHALHHAMRLGVRAPGPLRAALRRPVRPPALRPPLQQVAGMRPPMPGAVRRGLPG